MKMPVFVSFYTDNWIYSQLAEQLENTLSDMELPCDIRPIMGGADWLANTRIKPRFIRKMLDIYPRIIWIDADSKISQMPHMLLDFSEDLLLRPHSTVPGRAWHVSVMGWTSNDATKALCDDWIEQCAADGGTDEAAFDAVIANHSDRLSIGKMPLKYHRLPHDPQDHAVITIGISRDADKIRIKYGEGFK